MCYQGTALTVLAVLIFDFQVMRLSSREASSSIAFATLFTIGQFRLVGTPIRNSVTNQSVSDHSTSSESKTDNPSEASQEYVFIAYLN